MGQIHVKLQDGAQPPGHYLQVSIFQKLSAILHTGAPTAISEGHHTYAYGA